MKMLSSTDSYQKILAVESSGGQLSSIFKIMAPVQITVESCTGLTESDHYSIRMYSPNGCWQHSAPCDTMFRAFNTRPPHHHDYFELLFVLKGEIIQQIESEEYLYRTGTCCLINRSILHAEHFIGAAKVCFVGLSVDFVKALVDDAQHPLFEPARHLEENPVIRFMLDNMGSEVRKEYQDLFPMQGSQGSTETMDSLVQRMTEIFQSPTPASDYHLKGLLCDYLDTLRSGFYATPVHLSASPENLLFLRISRLLEDTDGRLSRSELSHILSYNGSYLNTIVQRHTGMCLFDYGMTFCFKKAEHLLKDTDLSVSEIAVQLNFSNRTHFYALFRKQYGMTPQAWRKQTLSPSSVEQTQNIPLLKHSTACKSGK